MVEVEGIRVTAYELFAALCDNRLAHNNPRKSGGCQCRAVVSVIIRRYGQKHLCALVAVGRA